MTVALDAVVDGIAAYRLTRLVTSDTLTAPARDVLIAASYERSGVEIDRGDVPWTVVAAHDPDAPWLATLLTCHWCASVWVGFGVVAARRFAPRAWRPLAEGLALASVAAWIKASEPE